MLPFGVSRENFLEEVTVVLGKITRGKFLQVHVVWFGQEGKREVMGETILGVGQCELCGKVSVFTA